MVFYLFFFFNFLFCSFFNIYESRWKIFPRLSSASSHLAQFFDSGCQVGVQMTWRTWICPQAICNLFLEAVPLRIKCLSNKTRKYRTRYREG